MKQTDGHEHRETDPDIGGRNEQNVSHQHLLDFFVAFRGPAQEQDRGRRRHHVGDADDRLLRNLAGAFPGHGKDGRTRQSKSQGNGKGGPAMEIDVKEQGHADA